MFTSKTKELLILHEIQTVLAPEVGHTKTIQTTATRSKN